MDELIQYFQSLLQYAEERGASLNAESQRALADFISQLSEIIETQMQQQSPADGLQPSQPIPQLDQGPYPSSNVNSFKYDPTSGTLFVKFHGQDSADSGPTYRYGGVPRNIYDVFSRGRVGPRTSGQNQYHRWIQGVTPSLGASLYALIREGGYPYQRVA